MSSNIDGNQNNFLPETYIFPENDPAEYDLKLRQYLNNVATAVNSKTSGLFEKNETITGEKFVPIYSTNQSSSAVYRSVYRKVIDTGALPNATTSNIPHGITTTQDFTIIKLYGTATDPATSTLQSAIPIPYLNVTTPTDGVELSMDATNIILTTTTANYVTYTRSFVVVEYIKEI